MKKKKKTTEVAVRTWSLRVDSGSVHFDDPIL